MATYTFEDVNRKKATHINADTRNLLDGYQRDYPNDNYLSGDGKSTVWKGHAYYAPHNRSWRDHHEVKALPWDRIPGLIEFQSEDEWREWQKKRDTPGSGKYCASSGFRNAIKPELKLDGYAFNPFNLYRTGTAPHSLQMVDKPWPAIEPRTFPTWRGPRGYYGYYHQELDVHGYGGYRIPRSPWRSMFSDEMKQRQFMASAIPDNLNRSAQQLLPVQH